MSDISPQTGLKLRNGLKIKAVSKSPLVWDLNLYQRPTEN